LFGVVDFRMQLKNTQWYLAATKPKEEKRALENLQLQDIEAFLPLMQVEKMRRGKRVQIEETLFPGYIFIHLSDESDKVGKIRSTRGIRDWIRFEGKPAKVPVQIIDLLKTSEQSEQPNENLPKPGDKIEIKSGPFANLQAIYQSTDGLERSILLLDFLGKQQTLSIENINIEKC
jgi:transcriptional antiterminator RfaH